MAHDPGLVGEWATSDATGIRVVIIGEASGPSTEPYGLSLTVHDDGECKNALRLGLTLTEIGGAYRHRVS